MNKKNILTQIAKKHTQKENDAYLDYEKVNQEKSFYIKSKVGSNGSALIFQYVEMLDGSIYLLMSESASHKGTLPTSLHGYEMPRKAVKEIAKSFDFDENFIKY